MNKKLIALLTIFTLGLSTNGYGMILRMTKNKLNTKQQKKVKRQFFKEKSNEKQLNNDNSTQTTGTEWEMFFGKGNPLFFKIIRKRKEHNENIYEIDLSIYTRPDKLSEEEEMSLNQTNILSYKENEVIYGLFAVPNGLQYLEILNLFGYFPEKRDNGLLFDPDNTKQPFSISDKIDVVKQLKNMNIENTERLFPEHMFDVREVSNSSEKILLPTTNILKN